MNPKVTGFPNRNIRMCAVALLGGLATGVALGVARRQRGFSFAGRTVVITGGSRGLGLVLAREFLREGARVGLLAPNADELRRAAAGLGANGAEVLGVPCDVRNQNEVNDAVRLMAERFGGIDVLVNNAGIIQVGPMEHMTVADFSAADPRNAHQSSGPVQRRFSRGRRAPSGPGEPLATGSGQRSRRGSARWMGQPVGVGSFDFDTLIRKSGHR